MKLSPIQNCKIHKPKFTSTTREVYNLPHANKTAAYDPNSSHAPDFHYSVIGQMLYSNYTCMLRPDVSWGKIVNYFQNHYPEGKVNIYNFACSDGSEPYSLAMALIETLGEKEAQRFFPIKASDIDKEMISRGKNKEILVNEADIIRIKIFLKDKADITKYFEIEENKNPHKLYSHILKPKKILSDNIIFENKSIQEGIKEINSGENNIILARNFWKYLPENAVEKIMDSLKNKLTKANLVLFGQFDENPHISEDYSHLIDNMDLNHPQDLDHRCRMIFSKN